MDRLPGKVVMLVGCASGIGAGSARLLAREGARLALGDIDVEGAERTAAAIRSAGGEALAMKVDIAEEEDLQALAERAVSTFGGIDGLANIAADTRIYVEDSRSTAIDMDLAVWDRTMAVNARGFLLAMRAVVPEMLRRGAGAIVNISSVGASRPQSFAAAYCASKAAVDALTAHVAAAYGRRGIRCNAIAPGPIRTPENNVPAADRMFADIGRFVPSPRLGQPEDIGAAIAFLLSDAAAFINGEIIRVDGGALCHAPWSAEVDFGTL